MSTEQEIERQVFEKEVAREAAEKEHVAAIERHQQALRVGDRKAGDQAKRDLEWHGSRAKLLEGEILALRATVEIARQKAAKDEHDALTESASRERALALIAEKLADSHTLMQALRGHRAECFAIAAEQRDAAQRRSDAARRAGIAEMNLAVDDVEVSKEFQTLMLED